MVVFIESMDINACNTTKNDFLNIDNSNVSLTGM